MTPTELKILRRHAKPGHEEALVDIVTLIVERASGEAPTETITWADQDLKIGPMCPHGRVGGGYCPHCMGTTPHVETMPDGMEICTGGFMNSTTSGTNRALDWRATSRVFDLFDQKCGTNPLWWADCDVKFTGSFDYDLPYPEHHPDHSPGRRAY